MGIPRRNKHDKENVQALRPWDNAQGGVKALCAAFEEKPRGDDSRRALQDFIEAPAPHLRTRLGNRELKPLVTAPKPPPLVGLPIPNKAARKKTNAPPPPLPKAAPPLPSPPLPSPPRLAPKAPSPTASQELLGVPVEMEVQDPAPDHVPTKLPEPATPGMKMEDPELLPRFSYRRSVRQSVRLPSLPVEEGSRSTTRHSRRVDGESLNFLPQSSSFLDFDEDARLSPLDSEKGKKGVWKGMSFDEADSFDTFESLGSDENEEEEDEGLGEVEEQDHIEVDEGIPRPESNESEKPLFPAMSFTKKGGGHLPLGKGLDEEDDGALDVPKRMTRRPGAEGALRDLQRASITAGREIQLSLRMMAHGENKKSRLSKVQGDLLLRSRILRRWNLRYASIVQQGYFGAVLLLFRPEGRGVASALALRSSKMIALADTSVRKIEGKRPDLHLFEMRTSQRTYTFACNDEEGRDFWVKHLGSPAQP